jgi:site-specific recombinase XerD
LEPVVSAHELFLRSARGLAEGTVTKRTWQLARFAEYLERTGVQTIATMQAKQIQQFFTQLQAQSPATRRGYGVTLRSLFRWAYVEGRLPIDLSAAAITTRHYRQARIRDVLGDDEIARVLDGVNRSSVIGRRDYAVLLLAARYGMRP